MAPSVSCTQAAKRSTPAPAYAASMASRAPTRPPAAIPRSKSALL
jgi:hypothetical protein